VVVVDQHDLPVANVDVARHLDKGRLGRCHHAERLFDRAPVPRHHPEEQIGGARLIALQNRLGDQVKRLVLANLVSIEQHCDPSPPPAGDSPQRERTAPAGRS
jgi:hypothetical protein